MSLLTKIRARAGAGLARTRIGAAVVVHAPDGVTAEAQALAAALPADPEHELVVADLPSVSSVEVWKAFVAALPRGSRPLRVVPGQAPHEIAPYVWQWLADRVGRGVLAPYGRTHQVAGSLFVHSVEHSGWVWFRRNKAPAWKGKRFPRPDWDSIEVGQARTAGFRGVAEPLPAGMWLRPDVGDDVLTTGRARLTRTLPCLPGTPTIVLGAHDVADIELTDIAAFMRTLPADTAARARFVRFGGVALPDGVPFGQALADVLDTEVCCYTGIPAGTPDALEVLALRQDSSLGRSAFAQAFIHRPRTAPRLSVYRPPFDGLAEVSPGIYWYAPNVVLEIVRAGLWIRPAEQVTDPAGVRTVPLDPAHNLLLYDATDPTQAERLREAAKSVLDRLDPTIRPATRLMPTTALSDTALAGLSRTDVRTDAPRMDTGLTGAARTDAALTDAARTEVVRPGDQPVSSVPAAVEPAPIPEPEPKPEPEAGTQSGEPADEPAETDLPWLSRLMETMSMPVPVRQADPVMERRDDRAS